jgi:transcriptional regulator with XRE-family HTH domain
MNSGDELATRLRSERQRLGLTLAGMAEALGVPAVTYRSYESARSEPPASFFVRLIRLGADAHFVFAGETAVELLDSCINWALLAEISELIRDWSDARPRPLALDEQARFLRLAFSWASKHGREAAVEMLQALAKAA